MKRFIVLVVGLAFLFSTVAFAAEKGDKGAAKKEKAAVSEKAPAAAPDAAAAPAADTKAEKKAEKKTEKKAEKKAKAPKKEKKAKEEAPATK
ncbi:MAG: hypothetical protein L7F78_02140 [Syntrophales bacterium LBB04]|nr:hypothetical protein [Syntrophales bacterium LBB04]